MEYKMIINHYSEMKPGLRIESTENKLVYNNGVKDMVISNIILSENKVYTDDNKFCFTLTSEDLETYAKHREIYLELYL